jgi:hypothetical protein
MAKRCPYCGKIDPRCRLSKSGKSGYCANVKLPSGKKGAHFTLPKEPGQGRRRT